MKVPAKGNTKHITSIIIIKEELACMIIGPKCHCDANRISEEGFLLTDQSQNVMLDDYHWEWL